MDFNVSSITPNAKNIRNWNVKSTRFFHPKAASAGNAAASASKFSPKGAFQKAGMKLNGWTYSAANKTGLKLMDVMTKPGSKLGGYLCKVPGLGKVAEGLSKLGTKAGSKIPGIGTIIALGTGLWGVVKAGGKALQGDWKGAGHQLVKSAGSVAGIIAGAALCMTGVGIPAGIALAVGAGYLGDKVGEKSADALFGKVDENGYSQSFVQKYAAQQQNAYNQDSFGYTYGANAGSTNAALGSNEQFEQYISNIMSNPYLQ